jgi:predicted GNAT family acetyltransferase
MHHNVTDNSAEHRFELEQDGQIAFADYRVEDGIMFIDYVESPLALRGTGVAGKLMEGVTGFARERDLKMHPVCGYAASWLHKHKEYRDLMAP